MTDPLVVLDHRHRRILRHLVNQPGPAARNHQIDVVAGTEQHVDMDRLGLTDGETYLVRFFFANRQSSYSQFRMRTNIPFSSEGSYPLSGAYD